MKDFNISIFDGLLIRNIKMGQFFQLKLNETQTKDKIEHFKTLDQTEINS